MGRVGVILCGAAVLALLWGCAKDEPSSPTGSEPEPILDTTEVIIVSAQYAGPPIIPFPSSGDIWMSTWGDDDLLYITWGDGAGPGQQIENPLFGTDAGVAALEGAVPEFTNISSPFECIRSIHVPDGIPWGSNDDKPSSLLCCGGRLYFAGHSPLGDPNYGYIAYSDDHGLTWTEVPNSPWTKDANSVFRILMLINMGKNYGLNTDGYVYGLGIGTEWGWYEDTVYLCRVSTTSIENYDSYEYYVSQDSSGAPIWSAFESDAGPLAGLHTYTLGSAVYHEGSKHYLFLGGGGFYAAPQPWGPWQDFRFLETEYNSSWQGGYMPGLISKDAGEKCLYFTLAGQDSVISYNCHIGKIQLELAEIIP